MPDTWRYFFDIRMQLSDLISILRIFHTYRMAIKHLHRRDKPLPFQFDLSVCWHNTVLSVKSNPVQDFGETRIRKKKTVQRISFSDASCIPWNKLDYIFSVGLYTLNSCFIGSDSWRWVFSTSRNVRLLINIYPDTESDPQQEKKLHSVKLTWPCNAALVLLKEHTRGIIQHNNRPPS